jgi:RNA-directed DNA polymerase
LQSAEQLRLADVIAELRPVLTGWVSYYRKSQVRITFERLDQWIRRKLRAILWRQWKRPWTRAKNLILAPGEAWERGKPHEIDG